MPEDFERVDDLKVERNRESRRIHPRENPDCLIVSQHPSTPSAHPQHAGSRQVSCRTWSESVPSLRGDDCARSPKKNWTPSRGCMDFKSSYHSFGRPKHRLDPCVETVHEASCGCLLAVNVMWYASFGHLTQQPDNGMQTLRGGVRDGSTCMPLGSCTGYSGNGFIHCSW